MSAPVSMTAAPATTAPTGPSRAGRPDGEGADFEQALRAQAGTTDEAPPTTADTGSGAEQSGGDTQPTTPDAPAVPVVDPSVAAQLVTPLVALPVAAGTAPTGPVTGQESTNVSVLAASVTPGSPAGAVKGQEPTNVSVPAAPVAPVTAVEGQESTNVSVLVAPGSPGGVVEGQESTNVSVLVTPGPGESGSPVPQAVPSVLDAPAGAEPLDAPPVPVPAADTTPAPTSVLPTAAAAPAAPAAPVAAPAPTSASAPAAPPLPVHSQVVTAVTPLLRGPDGTHELTLRLDPDGLGAVHVRLSVSGDEVRMHLVAADAGTREALRDGLAELRTSLEEVGLRATQLDVGTGSDPRGQTGPGADPQHRARGAALPAGRHGPAPPDPAGHLPAPARTDHRPDTRLDLRM